MSHAHHHHDHAHDHGHDHSHDADSYYLDQLCMIGLSAAYGAICLSMYFWQTGMLNLLLGPQFHPFVLVSGIALLVVALVRAVTLWRESGTAAPAHVHEHVHGPDCAHDHPHGHAHGDHAHAHGDHDHSACGHDHSHDHDHAHHHHGYDHSHEDHDHGWAPWRYVVLLVPIILFLLGLPNKGPAVQDMNIKIDTTKEAISYAALVTAAPYGNVQLGLTPPLFADGGRAEVEMDFKKLEALASQPAEFRADWKGKVVSVKGQYSPSSENFNVFGLVRFRIQCCAGDAVQNSVPMMSREDLRPLKDKGIKPGDWIEVTGAVDFRERGGQTVTILVLPSLRAIRPCPPDNNPYIQ